MINNNLDYEKNSNTTIATTIAAATNNSNSDTANVQNTSPTTGTAATTTKTTAATTATTDNSYFNRFDNRIAANLAAVLNGSRFRSSSLGRYNTNNKNNDNNIMRKTTMATTKLSPTNVYNGVALLARNKQQQQPQPQQQQQDFHHDYFGSRLASPSLNLNGMVTANGFGSIGRRRPLNLFIQANFNCNDNEKVVQTPSSDEDNSPTELNNCKRLTDKPPLVKRLTMGLLRTAEESRPLVANATAITTTKSDTTTSTTTTTTTLKMNSCGSTNPIYSNGYVNDDSFEPEKFIDSKFGDSCRQSLTAIPMLDNLNLNDNSEFNLKKRYLRETSSANSSPKIFVNRLRLNNANGRYNDNTTYTNSLITNDEEADLKDACWYQAGISRDIAIEVLSSKSPGAFLVRKSSSKPGCYALTLRVPAPPGPKIANYIVLHTGRGYKIKGFRKEFSSLKALITHHSVMPELLPVPLAMPRPTNMSSSRRNIDDFDTYDSLQMLLKYLRTKNMENE